LVEVRSLRREDSTALERLSNSSAAGPSPGHQQTRKGYGETQEGARKNARRKRKDMLQALPLLNSNVAGIGVGNAEQTATVPPTGVRRGASAKPRLVRAKDRLSALVAKGRRKQVTQVSSSYLLPQVVIRVELFI
jgi:hypothetical protein